MPVQKKHIDLEKLTEALVNLDPEKYPDYTNDWPIEELRNAIQEGDESEDSLIHSAERHLKHFKSNPL